MSWTACVVRIHRKGKVETFLADTEKFVIGRSPECDFPIVDNQISRQHLGFLVRKGQIYVKDLGSANGSFVDDQPLPTDMVVPYPDNSQIRLGNTTIAISVELIQKKVDIKTSHLFEGPEAEKLASILEESKQKIKSLYSDYEHLLTQARLDFETEMTEKRSSAEAMASSVLAEAKVEAEKIRAEAMSVIKQDEEKLLAESRKKAEEQSLALVKVAEAAAQDRMTKVALEADAIQKRAEAEALRIEGRAKQQIEEAESLLKSSAAKEKEVQSRMAVELEASRANAQGLADKIIADARLQAEQILQQAKVQAEERVKEAESLFDSTKLEAEKASQRILSDVHKQVERAEKEFDARKSAEIEHARKDIEYTKSQLQSEHQRALARLESDFQLKNKLFEEECAIRRKQVERSLSSEIERVEDARKQYSKVLEDIVGKDAQLKQLQDEHASSAARLKQNQDELQLTKSKAEKLRSEVTELTSESERIQAAMAEVQQKKKSALDDIQHLKMEFQNLKSNLDKDAYDLKLKAQVDLNSIRQKENEDIQRYRLEEIEKIDQMRKLATEEIVKNKAVFKVRLSEKIESKVVSLLKAHGTMPELPTLQKDVFELVQNSIEEQSFELAQGHEADIRRLVSEETGKRKSAVRRFAWVSATAVLVIAGVFVYSGGDLLGLIDGVNPSGETAAEEAGRKLREERKTQKFNPPQSDFIKSTYTDNVLYTRNFVSIYNEPQLQEKWIRELNKVFSKEWSLDDDAVVKFVAAESTLVARLQLEKESVVLGYEQIGIDKMRKVEKETTDQMKDLLRDSFRMRKFQSISEKFWHEALKERLPASSH